MKSVDAVWICSKPTWAPGWGSIQDARVGRERVLGKDLEDDGQTGSKA